MRKLRFRVILAELVALSLLASALAILVLSEEEHQITATLQAPEPESGAEFGYSVAVSGNIGVVGEPYADVGDNYQAGKAYIFDSDGNLLATLQSPEPQERGNFGRSVAVSGDILVVGEVFVTVDGENKAGKVYIFNFDGNLQATLQSPEPDYEAYFGFSVAVSGDTLVVSEPGADVEGVIRAGKVYLYDLDWNLLPTLQSPEPYPGTRYVGNFGGSVAVSGGIIVVGEPITALDDINQAGRVFIFDSEGNLLKTLESPEPQTEGSFGHSVAVSEDIIVVGEYYAEVDGYSKAGKVYIFDLVGNLLAALQSPEPEENGRFGSSVAISGDTIIVGEPSADVEAINEGRAYIFDSDGGFLGTLQAPTPTVDAEFGHTMAASEDIIVIGEYGAAVEGNSRAGRAYIFQAGAAAFTSSGLTIDPSSIDVGGTVKISVEVTNTGAKSGTHTVTLKIEGEVEDEKTVTLNPEETKTVSFEVSASQLGTFSVEIDGLSGSYAVTEKEKRPPEGIPGFIYVAIILGLVAGAFILWMLQRRR